MTHKKDMSNKEESNRKELNREELNRKESNKKESNNKISSIEKKCSFIDDYFEEEARTHFSTKEREKLKKYVEEGCRKAWLIALEFKAYSCYGGNDIYECDYDAALSCLMALIEKAGEDNPMYYNMVGNIYYYGRCTNGRPDYDNAFKYFSVAATNGVFESMYKLSDMYAMGQGVPINLAASTRIITSMYDENYDIFCNEGFLGKFADVAFRIGGIYERGDGCEMDLDRAYYYYLQAEYAVRFRISSHESEEDERLLEDIKESLSRVELLLSDDYFGETTGFDAPAPFGLMLSESAGMDVEISKKGRKYYLTAYRIIGEDCIKNILVTIPELNYCSFVNQMSLYLKGLNNLSTDKLPERFFITAIHYNEEDDLWEFACRDRIMLSFSCKEFVVEK